MADAAADPAAGVLSVRLERLTGLPPRADAGSSVVQLVATLLQGSRREQRSSAAIAYGEEIAWLDDEVLEFGGVMQSARVFFDVYAHHGVSLPASASSGSPLPVPSSSVLLGKVAVCVDELAPGQQHACSRRLLAGSLHVRVAFACVQGVPARPLAVHAPSVCLTVRGRGGAEPAAAAEQPAASTGTPATALAEPQRTEPPASLDMTVSDEDLNGHEAKETVQPLGGASRRRPSLTGTGRSLATVGRTPSILISEAGDDDELTALLDRLSRSQGLGDDFAELLSDEALAKELRELDASASAHVMRLHRTLCLLAMRRLATPASLLLGLARNDADSPAHRSTGSATGSNWTSPRRHSWAGNNKQRPHVVVSTGGSETALDRVRSASDATTLVGSANPAGSGNALGHVNKLFDDSEFSDFVSDYTREENLELIESPARRARSHTMGMRRLSSRSATAFTSSERNSGAASPLSFAAAILQNAQIAQTSSALLRPQLSVDGGLSDANSIDSLALAAVPVTTSVPLGPHDPQVATLLRVFSPQDDGRPAARVLAWSLDIFELESVLGPATLPFLAVAFIRTLPLLSELQIDTLTFGRYVSALGQGYRPQAYHSATHGADAFQAIAHMLQGGLCPTHEGLSTDLALASQPWGYESWELTDAELLGLLVGTAAHDVDHTGQNNAYHVATRSELATTYNDVSVLENHHCAFAFKLMQQPGCDFASALPVGKYREMRETMVAVILGTDMSKHFDHVAHLMATVEDANVALQLGDSAADRRFLMQVAAHAADISNACRPTPLAVEWARRVTREFYAQGDMEKQQGLPVTKFFDRESAQLAKSQLGFFDFIVAPLFTPLSELLNCQHMLAQLALNRDFWADRLAEDEEAAGMTRSRRSSATACAEPALVQPIARVAGMSDQPPPRVVRTAQLDLPSPRDSEDGDSGDQSDGRESDMRDEIGFGGVAPLPSTQHPHTPRLTASALAASVGFKPPSPSPAQIVAQEHEPWHAHGAGSHSRGAGAADEPFPQQLHAGTIVSSRSNSLSKLRDRRPSVASIPETENEVDAEPLSADEAEGPLGSPTKGFSSRASSCASLSLSESAKPHALTPLAQGSEAAAEPEATEAEEETGADLP